MAKEFKPTEYFNTLKSQKAGIIKQYGFQRVGGGEDGYQMVSPKLVPWKVLYALGKLDRLMDIIKHGKADSIREYAFLYQRRFRGISERTMRKYYE